MKEKGRPVIPWFQTVFVIALVTSILGILLVKIFLGSNLINQNVSNVIYLSTFIIIGCVSFFSVKGYFFDSGRNLVLAKKYVEEYSMQRRFSVKIISIGLLLVVPILLGVVIWINAK